jgi:hypothetical protein
MKSIIALVIASLLAVAVVAVAIPNPVEANALWCFGFDCFPTKSACEDVNGKGNCFKPLKKG